MKIISIIVLILLLNNSCKDNKTSDPVIEAPIGQLEMSASFDILVPEPSGLSFGPGNNTLLAVSDNTNSIYELSLTGTLIRTIEYAGRDLEGVTYNPDKNLIAVTDERDREVALIDYESGQVRGVYKIEITIGSENSGLEGISYNSNNKQYYIVNETNPDLMVIWTPESGIISQTNLKFAKDYSGIFVDCNHSLLWFLSDESQRLYQCDYSINVQKIFNLPEQKFEGVVVDNDLIYLVNDASGKLYIFNIKNI